MREMFASGFYKESNQLAISLKLRSIGSQHFIDWAVASPCCIATFGAWLGFD